MENVLKLISRTSSDLRWDELVSDVVNGKKGMPSLALSSNHLMLPESIKTCNSADLQKSLTWTGCRWLAPPKQMLPFSPFLSSPQFCWMVVKVLVVVFIFQYFVYKSTKPRITFCRGRTLPTGRVEAGVRQISSRPQRERTPTSLSTILLRMLRNQTKKEQTTWCPAEPSLRSCDNTESCPLPRLSLRHCTMWCDADGVSWWIFDQNGSNVFLPSPWLLLTMGIGQHRAASVTKTEKVYCGQRSTGLGHLLHKTL